MTSDPEALARLALELVAVPSVTGEEAALADLVEARCRALPGVAVERLGNALVARVGDVGDAVALVGHLDTVPPWEGHEPRLEGTRVIGRGAADMKGGDAAILAVLEECAPHRRSGRVRVLRPRGGPQPRERHPRGARGVAAARAAGIRVRRRAHGLRHACGLRRRRQRRSRLPRPDGAQRAPVGGRQRDAARRAVPRTGGARCAAARRGRGPDVPRHALHHPDPRRRGAQRRARSRRDRAQRALRPRARGGCGARRGRAAGRGRGRADLDRREPRCAAAPVRAGAGAVPGRDGRERASRSRPGRTSPRCRRTASRP